MLFQGKDPAIGAEKIKELLDAVDTHIPNPEKELDQPFYLPVDGIFTISGMVSYK